MPRSDPFVGLFGAILALAGTAAAFASAHAGPVWAGADTAAVDARLLHLATTAGPPPPEAVREAQTLLSALGYRAGPADGVWGGRTASALRAFLRDAGLPATDGLTPDTLRALRAAAAGPRDTAEAAPAADEPPAPVPPRPSCEDTPEGAKCWKALSDRPECYVWDTYLRKSQTVSFSGRCRGGKVEGPGELIWSDGEGRITVEGVFNDGKLNGHGMAIWADGSRYEGDFRDGEMHGYGMATYPDGFRYEGGWRDGERHGYGMGTWSDGRRYVGGWRGARAQGWGAFTDADGNNYVGEWSAGCYEKDGAWASVGATPESCGF